MKKQLTVAAGIVLVASLAGCASGGGTSSDAASTSDAPLFKMLPSDIQESGTIAVASLDDLPPWVFIEDGEHVGIDVDLTDAMAELLGVTFDYTSYEFASMIPGLQANRFDLIINEIGDTVEREQAVSFVNYSQDYNGIIVPTGNPEDLLSLDDLCGLTVTVVQGSSPETIAKEHSAICEADGKAAITVSTVPAVTDAYLAVASGRADATINGYSAAAYSISQGTGITEGIELSDGEPIKPGLNGIAFNKDNTELGDAIQAALQQLMDDGTYDKILDKWGVTGSAIPEATINGAEAFAAENAGN